MSTKDILYAPFKDGGGTRFPIDDIMLPYKDTYNGNILIKKAFSKSDLTYDHQMEIVKCARDPIYFIEKYCRIISLDDGIIPFELYDYQKEMITSYVANRFNLTLTARQMGKTAAMAAYILWFAIFNPTKTIAVLANKMEQAQEIMDRIRMAFEYLPFFLQHGVKVYNKRRIEFDNGSIIFSSATSASGIRGRSVDLVYIDEAAFVENDITFYESTYPVITSGKDSRVIMTTTPRGARGMFYMLWRDATNGRNFYKTLEVLWDRHPKRDEKWKEVTIANIGYSRFAQEFSCVGYDSDITLLENDDFEYSIDVGDAHKMIEGNKYIVYLHTSPSGKSYVGKTKFSIRYRWKEHTYAALVRDSKTPFGKAIRKYGQDDWKHQVIGVYDSEQQAFDHEKLFIKNSNRKRLYNATDGGEGTSGLTIVKDKLGNTFTVSIDDPRFINGELVSVVCGTKKMVDIATGKVITIKLDDARVNSDELRPLHQGMKRTEESKLKMKRSAVARGANNRGYKHSDDYRLNCSIRQKGISRAFNDEQIKDIVSRYLAKIPMIKDGYKCPKSGTIKGYHSSFCEALAIEYSVKPSSINSTLSLKGVKKW